MGAEHSAVASSLNSLAVVLRTQGSYSEAATLQREALALHRKLWGAAHPHVASTLTQLALTHLAQGNDSEAEALFGEAMALYRKLLAEEHPQVVTSMSNLGIYLVNQGAYAKAALILLASFEALKQTRGPDNALTQEVISAFVTLYTALGKPKEAARYRAMRTDELFREAGWDAAS
jgi:tetratricopeptide (TPR) repeat protein